MFFKRPYSHVTHLEGVLGTSCQFKFTAASRKQALQAEQAALAEIDRLEAVFSAYAPGSELAAWQKTQGQMVPISPELAEVLQAAECWRQRTNGAFNPAVEALTRLWTQHARLDTPPDDATLAEIRGQMQDALWQVNGDSGMARRETRLPVTLNAIAKGFIIDRAAARALEAPGVSAAVVNIGGDIRHLGEKPVNAGITNPFVDAENAVPIEAVRLHNQGLATSGNYRRGFRIDGRWYSHVLDPRSGRPVEHLVSVSVFAPDTQTADVLATACCVLSPGESIALADELDGIGVLLIEADGNRISNSLWKQHSVSMPPVA